MAICVGCGLDVNGSGVLEVDLDGDPGSGIHCDNTNGLSLQIQHANTDSLILSGNGTTASPLSGTISVDEQNSSSINWTGGREGTAALPIQAQVTRSPDACNGIDLRGNGVYAPCPDSETGIDGHNSPQNGAAFTATGISNPFSTFGWQSVIVHICNPTCCTVAGRISYEAGGLEGDLQTGDAANSHLEVQTNGGAFASAQPSSTKWVHNTGSSPMRVDFNNMIETNWMILGPGECIDVRAQLILEILLGSQIQNLTNTVFFEIQWDLNQVGCC